VAEGDAYCAKCGGRQPVTPSKPADPLAGMSPRTASILCYIPLIGWIPAIVVLAADRFRENRKVRFHAFQGLYLFVAWLVVDNVIVPVLHMVPHMHFGGIMRAVMIVAWIFMIIKASHEEEYSLPLLGELAERSLAER